MVLLKCLAAFNVFVSVATAKYVFAHLLVGNTYSHTQSTWETDMTLAQDAGIDAFVLNVGYGDPRNTDQLPSAFAAAEALGSSFKLMFSFDYLGGPNGAWPASEVVNLLGQYKGSSAYFLYGDGNLPFVSTFEGTGNIGDWAPGGAIRSAGDVYFVPDWTSLGPGGISQDLQNIQGFFSWDMWPAGATNSSDAHDLAWKQALPAGKTFMMGVSPWFFHSASGGADWVWRGDDLWADRWAQTLAVDPDFVEIATWNDFGESHYIGPIHADAEIAPGSAVYVDGYPHDSWRDFLPYYIATYKGSEFNIQKDQMQYWYRNAPVAAGSTCGVVGDNPGDSTPAEILEDGIFFSALLTDSATVNVQIGGGQVVSFAGSPGINHWSLPFGGQTGVPVFSIVRNGATTGQGQGMAISSTTTLSNGCANYNAYVGSFMAS